MFGEKHPEGFSTFKITGLNPPRIWWLGVVKGPQAKPILARFDLAFAEYAAAGLPVVKSPPNSRHYDVNGFPVALPPPPSPGDRAKQISRRQLMVQASRVHIPPSGLEDFKLLRAERRSARPT